MSIPGSKGVPEDAVKNTLIAEFNNIKSVEKHLANSNDVAAVFIEPIAGNMGVVQPSKSFIKELRALTEASGVLLVADEVMTGFRSKFGGAQELLGFEADITCLGKVVGGGFPVGAYGARNEIMEMVAPLGDMYQAGTLSGNPIAMSCGIATLKTLKKRNPYADFEKTAAFLERVLKDAANKVSVSSTKSMTGHLLGASGAIEAIFSILAIRDQIAPPTINLQTPDKGCDIDLVPNKPKERPIKVAMSNSFGFGGTNATLVFKKID